MGARALPYIICVGWRHTYKKKQGGMHGGHFNCTHFDEIVLKSMGYAIFSL